MSLFDSPKIDVPKEDPAVAQARERQQSIADNMLTGSIQDNLRRKMQARVQRFGLVPGDSSGAGRARPIVQSGFMAPA